MLIEITDPEKIDRAGGGMANHPGQSLAKGQTLGTGGQWYEEDMGKGGFGDDGSDGLDELDELDEMEDEEE